MEISLLLFLFLVAIISIANGADREDNIWKELKNLKDPINEKIDAFQSEIHQKFKEAKMRDNGNELVRIFMELHNLYNDMSKRMVEGYNVMIRLQMPNIDIINDIKTILEILKIGHTKMEPALAFLESSKMILENIFNFLTQRLDWLDFMFKTTIKPFFEEDTLNKFQAMLEIRNLFGKILDLIERGGTLIRISIDKQQIKKFELYARHRYLLDIVNSAIELNNILAINNHPNYDNTMAARLGDNYGFDAQMKYSQLERNINFYLGACQWDAKPIDEEMAKNLANGEQNVLNILLNAGRNEGKTKIDQSGKFSKFIFFLKNLFKNLSLNETKSQNDWKQLREWECKVLIQVGQILTAYFGEEKYFEKIDILQAGIDPGDVDPVWVTIRILTSIKTETKDWKKDLIDYTNDAPLLKLKENRGEPVIRRKGIRVPQKSKYPGGGFVDLFLQQSRNRNGLILQTFMIMHIAQIEKEFDLVEKKEVKTGKDNFLIKKYNEHRLFIEGMAKMRLIVWPTLIFHIGMQHWYLKKSVENAEKVKKYFNGLQKTLRIYGIKNDIDASTASRLSKNLAHSEVVHNLYKELFGVDYDHNREGIEHVWTLLVSIGKLLTFFYKENEKIEKIFKMKPMGEASSSSVNVV